MVVSFVSFRIERIHMYCLYECIYDIRVYFCIYHYSFISITYTASGLSQWKSSMGYRATAADLEAAAQFASDVCVYLSALVYRFRTIACISSFNTFIDAWLFKYLDLLYHLPNSLCSLNIISIYTHATSCHTCTIHSNGRRYYQSMR